jgi:uncharacterized protein
MFRSFATAGALMLAVSIATPTFAAETKMPRTIAMTGHGEIRLAPDRAMVSAGVQSTAETAQAALAANSEAMNRIFAKLKEAGIDDKFVQTSNFTVQPRYDYGNNSQPKLVGYDVINMVSVTVDDLARIGALLDALVAAGSNQINGISFMVAKPQKALDEARKLAVQDAKRKAGVYTAAASVALGDVISISEGVNYPPPMPMVAGMEAKQAADTPIATGEQTLSVDVNITWEIK